MANIILIDTSTEVCSVALSNNGKIVWEKVSDESMNHSVLLAKYIQELTEEMRKQGIQANAVAVSCGPGSYTGLRIGVSTAKGLCFGSDIPLLAINTLQVMSQGYLNQYGEVAQETWMCPMIDARRMEVYTAFYDNQLSLQREISADIIDSESYSDILANHKIICFGNGANKCKETLTHPNVSFVDGITPLASNMAKLAEAAYKKKEFQDVAYFEPFYLKEFVATVSRNKLGV